MLRPGEAYLDRGNLGQDRWGIRAREALKEEIPGIAMVDREAVYDELPHERGESISSLSGIDAEGVWRAWKARRQQMRRYAKRKSSWLQRGRFPHQRDVQAEMQMLPSIDTLNLSPGVY